MLQITRSRHPISVADVKMSEVEHPNRMRKCISKLHKIGGEHLQYVIESVSKV